MSEDKIVDISTKELTPMEHLDKWLEQLIYPGKVKDFIEEIRGEAGEAEITREFCFYTEQHCYFINAIVRKDDGNNYIGCQVNARKARAGEDWVRGNDLPDGPFTQETWNKIVYAIVNYELVSLTPFRKPDEIPEDVA